MTLTAEKIGLTIMADAAAASVPVIGWILLAGQVAWEAISASDTLKELMTLCLVDFHKNIFSELKTTGKDELFKDFNTEISNDYSSRISLYSEEVKNFFSSKCEGILVHLRSPDSDKYTDKNDIKLIEELYEIYGNDVIWANYTIKDKSQLTVYFNRDSLKELIKEYKTSSFDIAISKPEKLGKIFSSMGNSGIQLILQTNKEWQNDTIDSLFLFIQKHGNITDELKKYFVFLFSIDKDLPRKFEKEEDLFLSKNIKIMKKIIETKTLGREYLDKYISSSLANKENSIWYNETLNELIDVEKQKYVFG